MPTQSATKATKTKKKTSKRKVKKNLVIVESPSKAKTIGKYLGSRYKVMASVGHIRDLPKSTMGIDIKITTNPIIFPFGVRDRLSRNYARKLKKQLMST